MLCYDINTQEVSVSVGKSVYSMSEAISAKT